MNFDLFSPQTLLILLQGLLIVAIAVLLARSKGKSPFFWGLLSLFFGIWALLVLVLLPRSQETSDAGESQEKRPLSTEESKKPSQEKKLAPSLSSVPELKTSPFSSGQLATADWYFLNEQKTIEGPFRLQRLQELANQGKVGEHSWVWCELFSQWQHIEKDSMLKSEILGTQGITKSES